MRRWTATMRALKERLLTRHPPYDQRRALNAAVRNQEVSLADAEEIAADMWPDEIEEDGFVTVFPAPLRSPYSPGPIGGDPAKTSEIGASCQPEGEAGRVNPVNLGAAEPPSKGD